MAGINWLEELRKRGIKTTPLPPLTPEQMEHIQKVNRDVKKFLKMMDEARKASAKSTLRFTSPLFVVAQHGQGRSFLLNTQRQR